MLAILIAEDERDVATVVGYSARMLWPDCKVITAADGAEALRRFAAESPDLVVLDVQMPPPDGFAVLERMRAISQVPILMLTVHGQTMDKVRAFDLGADDYLTKPFDHLELLARLRALVRRAGLTPATPVVLPPPLVAGDLSLDPVSREVRVQGRVAPLTATEFRLLEELVRHAGRTLPHAYLLAQVWGAEYAGDLATLRVVIGRLRRKLGDDGETTRYIHTERNLGYRFTPPR
ncbi:MAG TPA: response regulator transcription factor [Chloroflexota bacterium]|jgi:DNA-binding response OmpR family regulator|nr:response regulator transcription factor [Chloroflexota bacterium]